MAPPYQPLAVVVLAVIREPVRGTRARRVLRWTLYGCAGLVAAFPYVFVSIIVAGTVGDAVMGAAGFDYPSDGVPFLPGGVPVALAAGLALAWWVLPRPVVAAPVLAVVPG